jgi:tetratricopeptide (TPR) repeat protein
MRIVALEEELAKLREAHAGDSAARVDELEAELGRLREALAEKRTERRWRWVPVAVVSVLLLGGLKLGCVELVSPHAGEQVYRAFCSVGFAGDCYRKAVMAHRRDDLAAAERGYREGCDGGYLMACTNLGAMLDERDPPESERLARLACDGGEVLGCSNLASKLRTRDPAESERLARVACDGGSDLGCLTLARTLLIANRPQEALEAATRGVTRRPTLAGAHQELGHALLVRGDTEGAVASYRQAVQLSRSTERHGEAEVRSEPMGSIIVRELEWLRGAYPDHAAACDGVIARRAAWDVPP